MKMKLYFLVVCYLFASSRLMAQSVYLNGNLLDTLVNIIYEGNQGYYAPAGYQWSRADLSSSYVGYGGSGNKLADKFTVPVGSTWDINSVRFFAFANSNNSNVLPITAFFVEIWDGDPSLATSSIVAGDLTTNILAPNSITNNFMYRTRNTPSLNRKIWRFDSNLTCELQAGNYWIVWSYTGNIFFPDIQTSVAVAKGTSFGSNVWETLIDPGSLGKSYFPFQISYNNTLSNISEVNKSPFSMSPIPARNVCNFKFNDANSKPEIVEIFDLKGSKVFNEKTNIFDSSFSIDISKLEHGLYIVKILNEQNEVIYSNKLIKD